MWPCIQKDSSTLHWNRKSNCHLHASRESLFLVIYQNDFSNKKLHKETTKLLWLLLLKPQYFPTQAKNNFCEIDILLKYSPFIIFFVSYVTTSITKEITEGIFDTSHLSCRVNALLWKHATKDHAVEYPGS